MAKGNVYDSLYTWAFKINNEHVINNYKGTKETSYMNQNEMVNNH